MATDVTDSDLTVEARAKVNLYLRVGRRRADSFHELGTIFQSISLADRLSFRATSAGKLELHLEGASAGVPSGADNLVARSVAALAELTTAPPGVSITVQKEIPAGAGLAGGSADAAATLVALNELWSLGLERDRLLEVALTLGSDVPFCVVGGTVRAGGRGEELTPLPEPPVPLWFLVGISSEPLLTKHVYARWDELDLPPPPPIVPVEAALREGNLDTLGSLLHNDLEPAAFSLRPDLGEKKQALLDAGALGAIVSGSGPTLLALCSNESHAQALQEKVSDLFDRVEIASSQSASDSHGIVG